MSNRVQTVLDYVTSLMGLECVSFMEELLTLDCMRSLTVADVLLEVEKERIDEKVGAMDEPDMLEYYASHVGEDINLVDILCDRRDGYEYELPVENYFYRAIDQREKKAAELLQEYESRIKETNKQSIDMAYEHKEGQGSLFRNEKQNDRQPDLKGTILIGGVTYRVVGWERTSQSGTSFISLQAEPLQEGQSQRQAHQSRAAQPQPAPQPQAADGEDLPF